MLRLLLAIALASVALIAHAETPEQFCKSFLSAITERGFNATPDFVHPSELVRFKALVMPFLAGEAPQQVQMREEAYGQATSPESLRAMAPLEFMRKFVAPLQARLNSIAAKSGPNEVLGSIREGEVVHVVARTRQVAGGIEVVQLEVLTLKMNGDKWGLMLPVQIETIAQQLRYQTERGGR